MKITNTILIITGITLSACLFSSCHKDETANGNIEIRLTDLAGPYQEVNVDIQTVSVHMSGGSWIDLPTKSGVYDLLLLQNGIDTSLVNTTSLPAGKITQMRMILGTNNTVKTNNTVYNLTVPSGSESGIKLIGDITVVANQTLVVKLDFDANASILDSGGSYQLKPTIKTL